MKFNFGNIRVNGSPLTSFVVLSISLFILWVLLSGRSETRFLMMGICFSLLTAYICAPFLTVKNQKTGREFFLLRVNVFRAAVYFLWLLKEIFVSGLAVTKAVFRKSDVRPRIIYFRMDFENPAALSLLASSITLTPGTITLDVDEDGVYEVYALTDSSAKGLMSGVMQDKIAHMYGERCSFEPLPERETTDIKVKV